MTSILRALLTNSAPPVPFTANRSSLRLPLGRTNDQARYMQAMGAVGVLFSIVDKNASAVGSTDWGLYRKARSGRKEDRTRIDKHPALVVLNRPNDFYTRNDFIEAGTQHYDLTGETWIVLARDQRVGFPLEMWIVRPDRMAPVPDQDSFISGYLYTAPTGEQVPLAVEDVILIRRPNPLDPYRGIGPVQSVLTHMDSERYSAEWNRNFFLNSAEPGGVVQVPVRLSDAEFDEFSERWRETHQGTSNAHRVAMLENGAVWVPNAFTQRDMQFTELSTLSDEKIRLAFGFPKPMLGSVDDVNRANAEAGEYVFARWLVRPRLERWKAALNARLLPLFPNTDDLEFDFEDPEPENEEREQAERDSKVKAVIDLVGAGFDAAEILEWLELPDFTYEKPAPPPSPFAPAPTDPAPDPSGPPPGDGSGADTSSTSDAMLRLVELMQQRNGSDLAAAALAAAVERRHTELISATEAFGRGRR